MGIYLGDGTKVKVATKTGRYKSMIWVEDKTSTSTKTALLSSDNYTLKDSQGVLLLAKEEK